MFSAFLIHGSLGNPNENWFPWLRGQLEKLHVKVYAPQFPIDEDQNLQNWLSTFGKYTRLADKNTIMVGHSLGPAFILNTLERSDIRIKAAFFVAPFLGSLGAGRLDTMEKNLRETVEKLDAVNKTFMKDDFNWSKIKSVCGKFYIYSSGNDPYVPLDKGTYLADKLNARYKLIKNGGHLNSAAGYKEFPLLLDDIKNELGLAP